MSPLTRTIMVGVDLRGPSVAAARWTAQQLAADRELVLVHVVSVSEPPQFLRNLFPPTDQLVEDARRGGEERLGALGRSLGVRRLRTEVRVGRPEEELVEAAEVAGAELLVVGPHAEHPGLGKLLGSTAERVARRVTTSLLVARGLPPGPPRTMLLALDGGDLTDAVVSWGAWCARRFGTRLVAMHAVPPAFRGAVRIEASERETRRVEAELRQQAETWVREQIGGRFDPERTRVHVALGDAGLEILSAARQFEADLIVAGRHGGGRGRAGPFIGSVAEALLRNSSNCLLVVAGPPS